MKLPNPPKRPLPLFAGVVLCALHTLAPSPWRYVVLAIGAVLFVIGAWDQIFD